MLGLAGVGLKLHELLRACAKRRSAMAAPKPELSATDLLVPEKDMDFDLFGPSAENPVCPTKCAANSAGSFDCKWKPNSHANSAYVRC